MAVAVGAHIRLGVCAAFRVSDGRWSLIGCTASAHTLPTHKRRLTDGESCVRRLWHLVAVGMLLSLTGCVPTRSTIGGHGETDLKSWAGQARDMCLEWTGMEPPYSFTTDGCTLSPDGTWQSCCVEHDMLYWCGGSRAARRFADERLCTCVSEKGGRALAAIMYWGVRVGGHPWLPTYWRWGYGWPWPHDYMERRGQ